MSIQVEEDYDDLGPQRKPRFIQVAIEYGEIVEGFTLEDYLNFAVNENGYETVTIHGRQGSGKSSFSLQIAAWVILAWWRLKYGIDPTETEMWEKVLSLIVFTPAEFITLLESVTREERLPLVIWDDIGVHYTNSTFKIDIEQYSAIDSTWAAIRTKVGVIVVSIPLINRLAKNVKDNASFEVFIGRNQRTQIRRLIYLPGQKNIDANLFKPIIEEPEIFDRFVVPAWVWKQYWERRLDLTEQALATLKGVTDMGESEEWIPVKDASTQVKMAANTMQQNISRGIYRGKKVNGVLCLHREDLKSIEANRLVSRTKRVNS